MEATVKVLSQEIMAGMGRGETESPLLLFKVVRLKRIVSGRAELVRLIPFDIRFVFGVR